MLFNGVCSTSSRHNSFETTLYGSRFGLAHNVMEYSSLDLHSTTGQFDKHTDFAGSYPFVDSSCLNNAGLEMVGGSQFRAVCQNPYRWSDSASSCLQWAKVQAEDPLLSYTSSSSVAGASPSTAVVVPSVSVAADVDPRGQQFEVFSPSFPDEVPAFSVQHGAIFPSPQPACRQQMAPYPTTRQLELVSVLGKSAYDNNTPPAAALVESSSQHRANVGVERWGGESVPSPAVSKRGRDKGTDPHKVQQRMRKAEKNHGCSLPQGGGAKPKVTLEHADHILRERQRRDEMSNKFAVLESLLPPSSKRDRSTIVSDSADYVKNLHHRIGVIQQRRIKMAAAGGTTTTEASPAPHHGSPILAPSTSTWNPLSPPVQTLQLSPDRAPLCLKQINPKELMEDQVCQDQDSKKSSSCFPTEQELREINLVLKSCVEKLEVCLDLPHKIFIHMICRPQERFQSNVLQGIESLNLEVLQCNISSVVARVICIISAKPWDIPAYDALCKDDIIAAVHSALGPDAKGGPIAIQKGL